MEMKRGDIVFFAAPGPFVRFFGWGSSRWRRPERSPADPVLIGAPSARAVADDQLLLLKHSQSFHCHVPGQPNAGGQLLKRHPNAGRSGGWARHGNVTTEVQKELYFRQAESWQINVYEQLWYRDYGCVIPVGPSLRQSALGR